ncbi:MAG: hypothetical protein JXR48_09670 [Candidatus Delongbacteria bacterium]|nr:hypothetical protein [Candidatus Delongbacteria bacterium]MBN2835221.1 hypothetical protein [Candidatus Delongbacteria bacterium]
MFISKGKSRSFRLGSYAALASAALIASTVPVSASVVYTDPVDYGIQNEVYSVDFNGDETADLVFTVTDGEGLPLILPTKGSFAATYDIPTGYFRPIRFNLGNKINDNTFKGEQNLLGFNDPGEEKYGIKFELTENSGEWYYGWLKMSFDSNSFTFTIHNFSYDENAALPVYAGDEGISGDEEAEITITYEELIAKGIGLPNDSFDIVSVSADLDVTINDIAVTFENSNVVSGDIVKVTSHENKWGKDALAFYILNASTKGTPIPVYVDINPLNDAPQITGVDNPTITPEATIRIGGTISAATGTWNDDADNIGTTIANPLLGK